MGRISVLVADDSLIVFVEIPGGSLGLIANLDVESNVKEGDSSKAPEEMEFPFKKWTQFRNLEAANHKLLVDPQRRWTYDPAKGWSKSRNSPWAGQAFCGRAVLTLVGGRSVFDVERGILVP